MGEKKGKKDEGEKEKNGITVVLKTEMHCEGCATKILKCVKTIEGVEKAKAEWEANKLTVRGEVNPSEMREELQERLKKKVELISPQLPKKDKDGNNNKEDKKKSDSKNSKKDDDKSSKDSKKSGDKKPKEKEAPVTTAVLKLRLDCLGCIAEIHKIASKTKGVESITIDKEKELVIVKGTMDVKALAESLEEKMKRSVEIVPLKKDKDGGGGGGGEGNNNAGGGGGGKKNKKKNVGGDDGEEAETVGGMIWGNRMDGVGLQMLSHGPNNGPDVYGPGYGYHYPYPSYTFGNDLHAPSWFDDENPNACSVM